MKHYNAQCNYERNKKGMYGYFKRKNCLYHLCDEPRIVKDLDVSKATTIGNNSKGTMASAPINKYGIDCINNWLDKPAYGEEEDSEVKNLHKIKCLPLLKEMQYWNKKGNFDRVSALGMLMILREDRLRLIDNVDRDKKVSYIGDDPYFKRFSAKHVRTGLDRRFDWKR